MSEHEPIARPEPDVVVSCVSWLVECLALDPQLADEFERTPGKVAHAVGVPYDLVPSVLVAYWKRSLGDTAS